MFITTEYAAAAIVLALLLLIVAIGVFYDRIAREGREIKKIKEKVGLTEERFKKVRGFFSAMKGGKRTL